MLGILYILLNMLTGFVICSLCFPKSIFFNRRTYTGEKMASTPLLVCLPLWYVLGAFVMTWTTYFTAYFAAKCGAKTPLFAADMIIFILFTLLNGLGAVVLYRRKMLSCIKQCVRQVNIGEFVFMGLTIAFAAFLMWLTLSYKDGTVRVGATVNSDFSPHLGMIRSFSRGNNFPTSYSHFAGEDIKYHFLFQFMVGYLEYLGMRLDWAFNLPSTLCFAFVFWLLYVLAVKLTGKRAVGYIAGALFAFRSSNAVFDFFANPSSELISAAEPKKLSEAVWRAFLNNDTFIGKTAHEDWGLWNLNVYCNQRHLAIGLCTMLLAILFLLPLIFAAANRIQLCLKEKQSLLRAENPWYRMPLIKRVVYTLNCTWMMKESWLPKSWVRPILLGLLLGMCSFFNGSCVIGCLCVLFLLAFAADHRLEYVITAALTVAITICATKFFIKGSVVSPQYSFGFLAEVKTFAGVWGYIMTLCGILPFVLIGGFLLADGRRKWIWAAFTAPFILAFTLSLTIDITVNHKYIMMSLMLLAIPAASFLVWLWERAGGWTKIVAFALLFALTVTGIYDLRTIVVRNNVKEGRFYSFLEDDPITTWVSENATSQDIFLTPWYSLNNFVMGGAMLYCGWPYYAWSAGYDTETRSHNMKLMYAATTSEELTQLVNKNNIRYIVVDDEVRNSEEFVLNETVISMTYQPVFTLETTVIYDTHKPAETGTDYPMDYPTTFPSGANY